MPYTSVTLAQLRVQLAARWEGSPFWTDEEARLAINETLRVWNLLVGAWRKRVVLPTIVNSPYYTVPSSGFCVFRVAWNQHPLDLSSVADLDDGRPSWRGETTAAGGSIPTTPVVWAPLGFTRFVLWPADASLVNSLTLDLVAPAPVLIYEFSAVDLNAADLNVLLGMALRLAAFKTPGPRFTLLEGLERAFYQAAAVQSAQFRASALYRALIGRDPGRAQRPPQSPLRVELPTVPLSPESSA